MKTKKMTEKVKKRKVEFDSPKCNCEMHLHNQRKMKKEYNLCEINQQNQLLLIKAFTISILFLFIISFIFDFAVTYTNFYLYTYV